ncbi:MAG: adenosine kinase [Planctomycetota bacterium]|nr:MAG: adenosine kinase [Planctomycetota bacterium]
MIGKRVVGVGAALVDLLLEESDEFVSATGQPKGGMTLSELSTIEELLSKTSAEQKVAPGGSACNSMVGLARLGADAAFIGMCGNDDMGEFFESKITDAGVVSLLKKSEAATGRVLSIVTPDAERTMFTCLGAAGEFQAEALSSDDFKDAGIVYIEGYLLFNEALTREVVKLAKEAGAKIALDLASFQVVEICGPLMKELLKDSVDIVLANEDEAKAFTGVEEKEALNVLAELVDIAVVKLGDKGALLKKDGVDHVVEINKVKALDTTGAGDLWAAGFLYGLVQGHDLHKAGSIGASVAAEVVAVMGAHIPTEGWDRIYKTL